MRKIPETYENRSEIEHEADRTFNQADGAFGEERIAFLQKAFVLYLRAGESRTARCVSRMLDSEKLKCRQGGSFHA